MRLHSQDTTLHSKSSFDGHKKGPKENRFKPSL